MSQYDNKTLTDIKEAILASPRSPLLAFIGVDAKALTEILEMFDKAAFTMIKTN